MTDVEHWRLWFDNYRRFILHYASVAQAEGMEVLCVGAELVSATRGHESEWRRLIAETRAIYHGRLTYAANWDREFEQIKFWDALDYIGVQAYFPLAGGDHPTLDDLKKGWAPHVEHLAALSRRFDRPVLFTEIGYASAPGAAARPWAWGE